MRLQTLHLHNFRKFTDAHLSFHPQISVLIGVNGKGKTTILDAIAVMLATYFQGSRIVTGQQAFRKTDARFMFKEVGGELYTEVQYDSHLSAKGTHQSESVSWRRNLGDRGRDATDFIQLGRSYLSNRQDHFEHPLFLYYGAGRLWQKHRSINTKGPGERLDAYKFCLAPKSDHKAFESWFKRLTLASLQRGRNSHAIQVVRNAVLTCIPDAQEFFFDIDSDQILVRLESEGHVPFNQLSDGYRNMVGMVADIAHRAARLNPHLEDQAALKTSGIVLIDEIDLHLHPKWQRLVVRAIQEAFPNLQFIATTHSPFVIQSLDPGEVIDLDSETLCEERTHSVGEVASPGPADQFASRSIEDIAENVMGIDVPQRSARHQEMFEAAKQYYRILEEAKGQSGPALEQARARLDELAAPFSDNVAYHAFLQMERLSAGIDHPDQTGDVS